MPRKKLQNRLDNLFEDLKEAQTKVQEKPEPFASANKSGDQDSRDSLDSSEALKSDNKLSDGTLRQKKSEEFKNKTEDIRIDPSDFEVSTTDVNSKVSTGGRHTQDPVDIAESGVDFENIAGLSVPISVRGKPKLNLEIIHDNPDRKWSVSDQKLIKDVTDHISIALENAYLIQETESSLVEAKALYAITQAGARSHYLEVILNGMLVEILKAIGMDAGIISLYDETQSQLTTAVSHNLPGRTIKKLEQGIVKTFLSEAVFHNQKTITYPNLLSRKFTDNGSELDNDQVQSIVNDGIISLHSSPIKTKGKPIGILLTSGYTPWLKQNRNKSFVDAACKEIGFAIENARAFAEEQRKRFEAEARVNLVYDLTASIDLVVVTEKVFAYLADLVDYKVASFQVVRNQVLELTGWKVVDELSINNIEAYFAAAHTVELMQRVIDTRTPILIRDTQADPYWFSENLEFQAASWICVPLLVENDVIGVIILEHDLPGFFTPEKSALTTNFASQAALAIRNAGLYTQIHNDDRDDWYKQNRHGLMQFKQRVYELTTINSFHQKLSKSYLKVTELAHAVADEYLKIFNFDRVSILRKESHASSFRLLASILSPDGGSSQTNLQLENIVRINESRVDVPTYPAVEQVWNSLELLILKRGDDLFPGQSLSANLDDPISSDTLLDFTETLVLVPLVAKDKSIGIVQLESLKKLPDLVYGSNHINLVKALANEAAVAMTYALKFDDQLEKSEQSCQLDKARAQFLVEILKYLQDGLEYTFNFSKELRNILSEQMTDLQRLDMNMINQAEIELLGFINDTLDITKNEAGTLDLAIEESVSIPDLVKSVVSDVVGVEKEPGLQLNLFIDEDIPDISVDPVRIRQVLNNLIVNAANNPEAGPITIRAYSSELPDKLSTSGECNIVISVTESGVGKSNANQKILSETLSYQNFSSISDMGIQGLRLIVSRMLVELHGGIIGMESEPGLGTTIYFTLPVCRARMTDLPKIGNLESSNGSKTIMLVGEDEQSINRYEKYLNEHGYSGVFVLEPSQAVENALKIKPLTIILDENKQSSDMWQVLSALKNDPETRSIPVLVCTQPETKPDGIERIADGILKKPFLEMNFIKAVGELSNLEEQVKLIDVLVIDDDTGVLEIVKKIILSMGGYSIRTAQDGNEGLASIQMRPPDVVILDLTMPVVDGFTVLELIKQDSTLLAIPIIVFTHEDLTDVELDWLQQWSVDLVCKPLIKNEEFFGCIQNALARISIK